MLLPHQHLTWSTADRLVWGVPLSTVLWPTGSAPWPETPTGNGAVTVSRVPSSLLQDLKRLGAHARLQERQRTGHQTSTARLPTFDLWMGRAGSYERWSSLVMSWRSWARQEQHWRKHWSRQLPKQEKLNDCSAWQNKKHTYVRLNLDHFPWNRREGQLSSDGNTQNEDKKTFMNSLEWFDGYNTRSRMQEMY